MQDDDEAVIQENTNKPMPESGCLRIGYGTEERAIIAMRVLSVDKEVSSDSVRAFTVDGSALVVNIKATTVRALKMSITNLFEFIELVKETIDAFAEDA